MPIPDLASNSDETLRRLEDQIRWYDTHSSRQRWAFYLLKLVTITAAATIPVLTAILSDVYLNKAVTSSLSALIVVIEGFQQVFQLHANWILYRSTCESLKREKYLYLGSAGPYADHDPYTRHSLLAERVESLISRDLATWTSSEQVAKQGSKPSQRQTDQQ